MQLHDADWERARARSRRSPLPVRQALTVRQALACLGVACAVLLGCGDDGTEGLSSCPDFKIVLTKTNELACAPSENKTGAAGSTAKSNTQAGTAANSGNAGNTPPVPTGPWSCLQVDDTCSCQPGSDVGDSCRKPHPTCCNLVVANNRVVGCLCVPSETEQCAELQSDPATYPKVSQCPP